MKLQLIDYSVGRGIISTQAPGLSYLSKLLQSLGGEIGRGSDSAAKNYPEKAMIPGLNEMKLTIKRVGIYCSPGDVAEKVGDRWACEYDLVMLSSSRSFPR